jgi:hypothetical protein
MLSFSPALGYCVKDYYIAFLFPHMNYGGILGWVSLTFKRDPLFRPRSEQRAGLAKLETFKQSIREENKTNAVIAVREAPCQN